MSNLEPKYTLFDSVDQMLSSQSLSGFLSQPVTRVVCQPMNGHSGLAGGELSYVDTNAGRLVLKQMAISSDYVMYSTDDHECRAIRLWQYGLLDQMFPHFEHKIIAASRDGDGWAILMEDLTGKVFGWAQPFPPNILRTFLDSLAKTHALFWNDPCLQDPRLGLGDARYFLDQWSLAKKTNDATRGVIPEWLRLGWGSLKGLVPQDTYSQILAFLENPQPLLDALNRYPCTLLHGDFRSENLAYAENPVALDWQGATSSLMTIDLPWLTKHGNVQDVMSEEGALVYYRERLEAHLAQHFDEQDWQAMVALGYGVDALRWLGFASFFFHTDEKQEGRAWMKNSIELHSQRVMDALRWL
jgi:hypothetical protein